MIIQPKMIVEKICELNPNSKTNYAINIGCGNGKDWDPVYPLFNSGWEGIAIDATSPPDLFTNLPNEKVTKLTGIFVTPENIVSILGQNNCPTNPDILKIDIDSYDGHVLNSILLSGCYPKVIVAEVNPEIPPPISFSVLYDKRYRTLDDQGMIGGFYGMSLSYVTDLCFSFKYRLVELDFISPFTHDAVFIHEDYLSFQSFFNLFKLETTREMWLHHPPGYPHFREYGFDSLQWRSILDIDRLSKMVKNAIVSASIRKHNGTIIDFYFDC